jgi:hypothetical protein
LQSVALQTCYRDVSAITLSAEIYSIFLQDINNIIIDGYISVLPEITVPDEIKNKYRAAYICAELGFCHTYMHKNGYPVKNIS